MSTESDKAFREWLDREGSPEGLSEKEIKRIWDAALAWSRPRVAEKMHFLSGQITNMATIIADLKTKKQKREKRAVALASSEFVRPEWLPDEVWTGFEDMRKRIKKPLTDRARRLTITTLEELRQMGQDPIACLDQSTQRGWQGVFPIHNGNGGNGRERKLGA